MRPVHTIGRLTEALLLFLFLLCSHRRVVLDQEVGVLLVDGT